eukprot:354021-Chlamydomonas_euryale.AAC.3
MRADGGPGACAMCVHAAKASLDMPSAIGILHQSSTCKPTPSKCETGWMDREGGGAGKGENRGENVEYCL